jgi:hypothetical protein
MIYRVFILISILILGSLYSCQKENDYPIEPEIEFKEIGYIEGRTDTANVIISFTDGDGDIGFSKGDTLPPFNFDTSEYNYFYYNLHLITYYKDDDGVWKEFEFEDPYNGYGYRIKNLTPVGQNKSLKGTIQVGLNITAGFPDSVYFEVQLVDRALHISNTVQTSVIGK